MAASKAAVKKATATPQGKNPNPLQVFVWEGVDKRGTKMKGESLAKNANLLKADLRKQGITPGTVKQKSKPLFGNAGQSIKPKDIAILSRQLATMMQSGVPLVTSFEIIAGGQTNPKLKAMLEDIRGSLEGGSTLHESLGRHPLYFDTLFRDLVKAGEGAGVLDTILATIATYKEKTEALKAKIKKALFYPIAVIAVAIIVSGVLLIYVVPQFETLFAGFGTELPAFTQLIVDASRFMVSYWWLVAAIAFGTIYALVEAKRRSEKVAETYDRILLKLPIFGEIMRNSAIARFARTLATTFKAGVPLVEAMETVAGATGNIVYTKAVHRIREDVSVGYQLNIAMRQTGVFPHMVMQMTAIGEEAGALDTMLFKVAEFYEQEVENAVDALSSLIEPIVIVVIGTLVGSMVIGMYLPIFKLAAAVG